MRMEQAVETSESPLIYTSLSNLTGAVEFYTKKHINVKYFIDLVNLLSLRVYLTDCSIDTLAKKSGAEKIFQAASC